jgi:hypothetical protein
MRALQCSLLASLLLLTTVARGDEGFANVEPQRRGGNAALSYWHAQECLLWLIPTIADPTAATPRFELVRNGDRAPLNDDAISAMNATAMSLYFVHRGARLADCDWGLAIDELGPADEAGHVAQIPLLVGAACLRSRHHFENHRPPQGAADLIAVLRLAKHVGNQGRDGTRGLVAQLSAEAKILEVAARYLPQMDAAMIQSLAKESAGIPVPELFKNYLAAHKRQWVDWTRKFASSARENHGDWDAYWREIAMESKERSEIGGLLRKAAGDQPERLLGLADEAGSAMDQALKLAEMPEPAFRAAWRKVLKQSTDHNLIMELAGGEVEPILDNLDSAEARRSLFKTGVAVLEKDPQTLKDLASPTGKVAYRKYEGGFELSTKRGAGNKQLTLKFGIEEGPAKGR